MKHDTNLRNKEGYLDPTAHDAIIAAEEEERFSKLLSTIFYIVNLAGFHIEGRVVLVDERTGRTWR